MIKTYGPYINPEGRKVVVHYDMETKKRTSQSYPRYLMEQHLGRKLDENEQVDHINDDHTDDRIENYQLLSGSENIKKSLKARNAETKYILFICPVCKKEFKVSERRYKSNQLKMGYSGPHCSPRCRGIASNRK